MQNTWVSSSTRLPHEGKRVRFVLDERGETLTGTYRGGLFQSRWASYGVGRVRAWRAANAVDAKSASTPHDVLPRLGTFALLTRLRTLFAYRSAVEMDAQKEVASNARLKRGIRTRPRPARASNGRMAQPHVDEGNQMSL